MGELKRSAALPLLPTDLYQFSLGESGCWPVSFTANHFPSRRCSHAESCRPQMQHPPHGCLVYVGLSPHVCCFNPKKGKGKKSIFPLWAVVPFAQNAFFLITKIPKRNQLFFCPVLLLLLLWFCLALSGIFSFLFSPFCLFRHPTLNPLPFSLCWGPGCLSQVKKSF